jgi:hypothetical protein
MWLSKCYAVLRYVIHAVQHFGNMLQMLCRRRSLGSGKQQRSGMFRDRTHGGCLPLPPPHPVCMRPPFLLLLVSYLNLAIATPVPLSPPLCQLPIFLQLQRFLVRLGVLRRELHSLLLFTCASLLPLSLFPLNMLACAASFKWPFSSELLLLVYTSGAPALVYLCPYPILSSFN